MEHKSTDNSDNDFKYKYDVISISSSNRKIDLIEYDTSLVGSDNCYATERGLSKIPLNLCKLYVEMRHKRQESNLEIQFKLLVMVISLW